MTNDKHSQIIPFYGGKYPDLFEIERRCMDRAGKVIQHLDALLPSGLVLDVGAGNGFTAEKLTCDNRKIIPLEPDENMIDLKKNLVWTKGVAQDIPFHTNTFDAVYATWAFFFDGISDLAKGLYEFERVVKQNGSMIIVDNYGHDEFTSYAPNNISSSPDAWIDRGFTYEIIQTEFVFDDVAEAQRLLDRK